jgi:hypothetical protein
METYNSSRLRCCFLAHCVRQFLRTFGEANPLLTNLIHIQQPRRDNICTWSCRACQGVPYHEFRHYQSHCVHLPCRLRRWANVPCTAVRTVRTPCDISHLQCYLHWLHHRIGAEQKHRHVSRFSIPCRVCFFGPINSWRRNRRRRRAASSAWEGNVSIIRGTTSRTSMWHNPTQIFSY